LDPCRVVLGQGILLETPMRSVLACSVLGAFSALLACGARTDLAAGGGASSSSSAGGGPSCALEVCNGIDDDCDGMIDESCVEPNGCSDGTREGFVDEDLYPLIAACSGGWSVAGILKAPAPTCNFQAGNTSGNPKGVGCSAADLCAPGFHVCKGEGDVAFRSPTGCAGAADAPGLFFATRQGSTGCSICTLGTLTDPGICNGCSCGENCAASDLTANDLFGCGTLGGPISNCGILEVVSGNECHALSPSWDCGPDSCAESNGVVKLDPEGGGVLCCAD
jgi:hypothetical protein